ncbi:hypothetical protein B0H13DRAFT_1974937 [Mycena leptocephala]|nr:hypothetical protein B0H13DRAFT_1974937 [Mycena leptocephala]
MDLISGFQDILMAQLFNGLRSSTMDSAVIAKIIYITVKFAEKLVGQSRKGAIFGYEAIFDERVRLTQEMSLFCSTVARVDGWLDTVVSAAKLVRVRVEYLVNIHSFLLIPPSRSNKPLRLPEFGAQAIQWIYMALEHVNGLWQENVADGEDSTEWDSNTALTVDGLLQVLAFLHFRYPGCLGSKVRRAPSTLDFGSETERSDSHGTNQCLGDLRLHDHAILHAIGTILAIGPLYSISAVYLLLEAMRCPQAGRDQCQKRGPRRLW